jgi:hypothetical protein
MKGDFDGDSPFTPPPSSTAPTVLIAVAIGVLAFVGYWAVDWWSARRPAELAPHQTTAEVRGAAKAPSPGAEATSRADALTKAMRQRDEAQPTWTRCEADGKVSYSDADCAGAVQKSSSSTTQAALSTVPSSKDTASTTTIYRCKAYSGVVFWSSKHCNQKKALVDRMVEVPRGLSFKQQIVAAEQSLPRKQEPVRQVQRQVANLPARSKQEVCDALDRTIANIDARTRQPLTAWEQDHWRGKRKEARDQQFALRC